MVTSEGKGKEQWPTAWPPFPRTELLWEEAGPPVTDHEERGPLTKQLQRNQDADTTGSEQCSPMNVAVLMLPCVTANVLEHVRGIKLKRTAFLRSTGLLTSFSLG